MAKTGIFWSRTRLAATSSCVDNGFEAQSTTSAPPSRRQMARFAVSAVTCRQAETRMPFNGWFLMNSLRIICRTFMDWFAQSIRFLPRSAKSRLFTSQFSCVGVVDMLLLFELIKPKIIKPLSTPFGFAQGRLRNTKEIKFSGSFVDLQCPLWIKLYLR